MNKKTLILLPGYDGDGQGTFAKISQMLSKQYSCVIINYPYYHQTIKSYSMPELISYVRKQVEKNYSEKFHLLGFSMGGFLASTYAAQYPEDVASLTLVSSSVRPNLTYLYRMLITLAYYAFKLPVIAKLFSTVYCSPLLASLVKKSPLPKPRDNFPSREAYPVFGTLANILYASICSDIPTKIKRLDFEKIAILFKDDTSFPASTYFPVLTNLGFRVIVKNAGGHAVSSDYWKKVSNSIYR